MNKLSFLLALLATNAALAAEPICSYTAKLSEQDKVNSSGTSLLQGANKSTLAAVIRQDRANYYVFNKKDAQDTSDCKFSDKNARAQIDQLVSASNISDDIIKSALTKQDVFEIVIYDKSIGIRLAVSSDTSKASISSQTPTEINQSKKQAINTEAVDAAECMGIINIYIRNGGTLTEGNRKFFQKHASIDPTMKRVISTVDNCRNPNPSDPALHESCAKKLNYSDNAMYTGFLKGIAKMNGAYQNGDKNMVGVLALSCSR